MRRSSQFTTAEQTVWRHFLLANRRVRSRMDADLTGQCGMSTADYELLAHLADAPDQCLPMYELAQLARLSPSGLTRRFDALVRRGWAERERGLDDRRVVLGRLTDCGLAQLDLAQPVHDRSERENFFDLLDPGDVKSLSEAMGRLARVHDDRVSVSATSASLGEEFTGND